MDTLRIESKFKNARLYDAIERLTPNWGATSRDQGVKRHGPVAGFCQFYGLHYQTVCELLTLKKSPMCHGKVRQIARRLAEICEMPITELFPAELYDVTWPKTVVMYTTPTVQQLSALSRADRQTLALPPSQDAADDLEHKRALVGKLLETLTPTQREVIVRSYGLESDGEEEMYTDIARDKGVSRTRVSQAAIDAHRRMKAAARRMRAWSMNSI